MARAHQKALTLGGRVRWLLDRRGASYRDLADAIGRSHGSLHKLMHDGVDPQLSTLVLLADHFGVSLDWLAGRDTPPAPKGGDAVALRLAELERRVAALEGER